MVSRAAPHVAGLLLLALAATGCFSNGSTAERALPARPGATAATASTDALPAEKTGGFDGARAFEHVRQLVAFGPRVPGTPGNARAREYIVSQLRGFGCAVEEQPFSASAPSGRVEMANLIAKLPGKKPATLLLLTHFDTLRREGFVGANDGGSSTGVMLELARLLCGRERELTLWVAFLDGEEAFVEWSSTDGTYGSRQLAASLALSGELKNVKAVVLADMVGDRDLRINEESNSTPWLREMVRDTAARLGYSKEFSGPLLAIEDDHLPFLRRGVPAVDLIDFDYPPWHTPGDTLDKVSARSLGVVGHVILELLPQLEKKFR
jgi:hypothetical protein